MDKKDIINQLAINREVETLIENIIKTDDTSLQDLSQDIYLDLLSKNDEKIIQLYKDEQLKYFIVRMIINNISSKNSPYYYKYKKFLNDTTPLIEK